MKRLLVAIRAIPVLQILLLAVVVLLYLQWQEQRQLVKSINNLDNDVYRSLLRIDDHIHDPYQLR